MTLAGGGNNSIITDGDSKYCLGCNLHGGGAVSGSARWCWRLLSGLLTQEFHGASELVSYHVGPLVR